MTAPSIDILDADSATVSVAATTDANETGPVDGLFTVTQSATSATNTVISYTVGGTATAGGTDYTSLSGSVTVLAGATTATIDVTGIVADALVEGIETVVVTLTGTSNAGVTVAASPNDSASLNILDADSATLSIAGTTDGNETGPVNGQFTVTQSTTSASNTVVTYTVAGTASAGGTDYTSLSGSVTVLAGATTATIDVTGIVADALVEGSETVVVTLTGSSNPGIAIAAAPNDSASINILDADSASVSITATADGNEAGPVNGQFTVTQSASSASNTIITYTVAGTATAGGTDYSSLSGSVTVLAGATTATIDVSGIVADALVEGSETVIVTLTGTDNPGIAVAASPNDSATLNILDADSAVVSIAATTDANEVGPVDGQFTVTQSAISATNTVVTYTVAGTATAGGIDYTSLSGSVTVLAGATTATIDVTGVVADALVEGNETVVVTLTGSSNPAVTIAAGPNDSASLNILDANLATVSVSATTDANEAGPVDGQFTVTQSTTSASNTVVSYSVAGTAAGGSDYTALSGTVTVLAGATTATIDVTGIVADALLEGTETIVVTLTGSSNPAITVAAAPNDTASISLLDADAATVSIAATTDANEAGPVDGRFTITQSATSATDTTITYTVAGSATAGADYTALSGSATILAGATTAFIDVTGIVADALIEGSETVVVTLTGSSNPAITVAAAPNDTAAINLLDADSATVSIAGTTDANEAGPVSGQFTVTQSATSATDTIVAYTVAGTATAGTDYLSPGGSVTVLAGATTATIDVTGIVADGLVEGLETVVVTLSGTSNAGIAVAASPNDTASINIIDADNATVAVAGTADANEAGPVDGQFTVTQSATSTTDTVVSYTVAGSATAGTDYSALSGSVTVLAGASTATIDVTGIVADGLIEGSETVAVLLTGTSNAGITIAAAPNDSASINLLDADAATVSIAGTSDASEAGPVNGQLTVTQSATSVTDTIVSYTVAGSATPGADYAALSGTATILAGATTAVIDVAGIVADALVEGNETIVVTLTGTSTAGITVAAAPNNSAGINLLDADTATVSIVATTDGNEAGPVDGLFTVSQSAAAANDTVLAYTVAGTATAATDYTALSGTVTITAGSLAASIIVPVLDDADFEGVNETVIVTLSGITASDPGITIDAAANDATVNIIDNDSAVVSIAATTNGAEQGPVDGIFTVTQSAVAANDTIIAYAVSGTATSGSDYTALSGSVTVPGGATTATIIVPVLDDVIAEGVAETVIVTLGGITASDPGVAIAASPNDSATITIADNESDLITTKAVDNATPAEGDTITYTLTVTNAAGVAASNVSLTDLLPAGVSYVSDSSGGSYDSTTGLWSIGALAATAPNNVATLQIVATVDNGANALGQPITNTTTAAAGDQPDPDTTSDVLSASITVDNNADLVTTKSVDNPAPVEGSTIVYSLAVHNNGTAQASNVYLTDLLPAGVTYVSDDSAGTYDPASGIWTVGTLNNNATAALAITATVDIGAAAQPQPILNVTTAALADQPDPDATTDVLSAGITVNNNADLVTSKTVDNATPLAGDTVVYTLSVTNNGPADASNVSLTETLPAGVTYVSDDGAGAFDAASGVWTIGSLANAATATLNITTVIDAGAGLLPQPITNTITPAAGDQPDPDVTTDILAQDIFVTLIDANLVRATKTVGRKRAMVGEIIAYSIELRNTTSSPIGPMQLSDTPARGFRFVPGTAELNGASMADPILGMPIRFDIGTLPGLVDTNGNGTADPGEPGYAVISYRMVAGAGVAPGVWPNAATATVGCDSCVVSNTASASIEIIEDTLFDLGTIIGKVFYDSDQDGFQDAGEAGIAAAMVVLDDGTYVLTDEFGRYHFPGVKPGQRLLKINLASIAGRSTSTNDKTQILDVTPGLLAKANFGVVVETIDIAIGNDGQAGVAFDSEAKQPPVMINGSTLMPSLLVNGQSVQLATAEVRLGTQRIESVIEIDAGKLSAPIRFRTATIAASPIETWELTVLGAQDEVAYRWSGKGTPPEFVDWDGVRRNGKLIVGGSIYSYYLTTVSQDGQTVNSERRLFGVNRRNSVSLNLAGGAFVTGSHELTTKAKALLKETAKAIRAYPDEIVSISGHTDSVGTESSNLALAERRARSAYSYLHEVEGLPSSQFIVQAYGESRPIASNDTDWGREINRRVEISGDITSLERAKNYDPYRQTAFVAIAGSELDVDQRGNFRASVPLADEQGAMTVQLAGADGRTIEMVVQIPTLTVISPQGRSLIPVDSTRPVARDAALQTTLVALTEPGNTVTLNGESIAVDDEGQFTTPLSVTSGDNYFGLVARNPMGMLRIANLKLSVNQTDLDEPEFIAEPIPQLALQLPPRGAPMTNANLLIPGSTVPGNRVYINEQEINVDADGRFIAGVELKLGDNPFVARVVDADGHAGAIEETFVYNGNPMFFMALVDSKFSQLETSGNLQAAGKQDSKETLSEGGSRTT